jgi:hypothetical protein
MEETRKLEAALHNCHFSSKTVCSNILRTPMNAVNIKLRYLGRNWNSDVDVLPGIIDFLRLNKVWPLAINTAVVQVGSDIIYGTITTGKESFSIT